MKRPGAVEAGFTLIELLVVLAIIAVLAGILFPVLAGARRSGFKAQCVSHVRQLLQAVNLYTADHDRRLVPARITVPGGPDLGPTWCVLLKPYFTDERLLLCPSDSLPQTAQRSTDLPHSYGINYELTLITGAGVSNLAWSMAALPRTADLILFFDMKSEAEAMGASYLMHRVSRVAARHQDKAVFGYLDGHVKVHSPTQVDAPRYWNPTIP